MVTVSSLAHSFGRMDFSDLQAEHFYLPWAAYAQSKLANLLFASELQARSDAVNSKLLSVAAYPGLSATNINIVAAGPGKRIDEIENFLYSAEEGTKTAARAS